MTAILVITGIAAVIGLALAPFLLSWPQHVRWLIASTAVPDPFGPLSPGSSLTLEEVKVETVDLRLVGVRVGLKRSVAAPSVAFRGLLMVQPTHDAVALLGLWAAAGTPLLSISETGGSVSLHGPTGAVVGLTVVADYSKEGAVGGTREGILTPRPLRTPSRNTCLAQWQRPIDERRGRVR